MLRTLKKTQKKLNSKKVFIGYRKTKWREAVKYGSKAAQVALAIVLSILAIVHISVQIWDIVSSAKDKKEETIEALEEKLDKLLIQLVQGNQDQETNPND